MRRRWCILLVSVIGMAMLAAPVQAATIAYWRFEEGDGGTANDETANNHDGTIQPYSYCDCLWSAGGLCDPVPLTGAANNWKLHFDPAGNAHIEIADSDQWTQTGGFTVEAMIYPDVTGDPGTIISHAGGAGNSSWRFYVESNKVKLDLWDTDNNMKTVAYDDFALETGHTYCVAGMFNEYVVALDNDDRVTFYAKECGDAWSSSGELAISGGFGELKNSSTQVTIGKCPACFFDGMIDEVRFSSGVLQESELLCTPEPATASLAFLAAAVGALVARRKKRKDASPKKDA